jgi:hypothetical protein
MAAPVRNLFGTATTGATNSDTITCSMATLGASVLKGDRLVVFVSSDGIQTQSISSGAGWVKDFQINEAAQNNLALYSFEVTSDGQTVPNLVVDMGATTEMAVAHMFRIRASTAANKVNMILPTGTGAGAGASQGSSTNPNPNSLTQNSGATRDMYWIACWGGDGNNVLSTVAPTNYGNHQSLGIANTNGCAIGSADRTVNGVTNGTAEDPAVFTRATEQWAALTVGFYETQITGSGSVGKTLAAVTTTSASKVGLAGSVGKTLEALTSTSAGTVSSPGISGTVGVTLAALTSAAIGYGMVDKFLVEEGDSLTAAAGSWGDVWLNHRAAAGYTSLNVATGGHTFAQMVATIDAQIFANHPEVVGIFAQANNLAGAPDGATLAEQILSQFVDVVRAKGIKVVGFTSSPQAAPAGNPASHNPKRAGFDSAMRAAYAGGRLDGLADVAADPVIGPDAAAANTVLYTDGLHMTAYGYERLGQLTIPALDEAFGYPSDTTPNAFTLARTHANASTVSYSAYITPTGFDSPTPISANGGAEIEINDSGFWATADLLPIGGYFRVRRTSASTPSTLTTTVDIGGVTADWELVTVSGTLWTIGDLTTDPIGLFDLRDRASATVALGFVTTLQNLGSQSTQDALQGNGGLSLKVNSLVNGYPALRISTGTRHLRIAELAWPALLRGGNGGHLRYHTNLNTIRLGLGAANEFTPATLTSQTSPHINSFIWDAAAGTVVFRENGLEVFRATGRTLASSGSVFWVAKANTSGISNTSAGIFHATGTTSIGVMNRTDGISPYDGDMSAWVGFDYALTQTEIEHLEGAWGHEFDLTLNGAHPFVTAPPTISSGISGTVVKTLGALTSSSASALTLAGSVGKTLAPLTSTSVSDIDLKGQVSRTLAALTSSSAADLILAAQLSKTLAALTASSVADLIIKASLTKTLAPLTAVSSSTIALKAQVGKTLAALTSTAISDLFLAATLTRTLGGVSSVSASGLLVRGQTTRTLAALTSVASGVVGNVPIVGALNRTLAALTSTSGADLVVKATLARTLAALVSVSEADLRVAGSVGKTLAALTATSSSDALLRATLARTLAPLTAVSVADLILKGTAAKTLGALSTTSSSDLFLRATLNRTLQPLTITAFSGTPPIEGQSSITLSPLSSTAGAGLRIKGQAGGLLAGVSAIALADIVTHGSLLSPLGLLSGSVAGQILIDGVLVRTLAPLTGFSSGQEPSDLVYIPDMFLPSSAGDPFQLRAGNEDFYLKSSGGNYGVP